MAPYNKRMHADSLQRCSTGFEADLVCALALAGDARCWAAENGT